MCTVTLVPAADDGFRLVCNRDERLTRPLALSPGLHRLGRRTAIYPIDPAGGGTWIGVNDAGLAVALLNRSRISSSAGLPPSLKLRRTAVALGEAGQACLPSRGAIVPPCLACGDVGSALTIVGGLRLDRFAPFSVVLVHRRRVAVAVSDGRGLSVSESVLGAPLLFTSSSLGDAAVDWPRRQLFEQLLGGDRTGWFDGQASFHEHRWPERPEISVFMERQDAATVSRSVVDVSPRRIRFRVRGAVTAAVAGAGRVMNGIAASVAALALGTLVSEDLTCIAAGLLIGRGDLGVLPGVLGCTAGILLGDVGLWALGRVCGQVALDWRWVGAAGGRLHRLRAWLERHAGAAIVGSRFLPGSRLPLYVLAGALKMPAGRFVWWASVGSLLWTPAFVLLASAVGETFAVRLPLLFGSSALVALTARALADGSTRRKIGARLARWSRWEFWPMWLFYAPVVVYIGRLAWRHRGIATITAANPGIPDGGTVGESKSAILRQLPTDCTIPFALIAPGSVDGRTRQLSEVVAGRGWAFPIVLKPDVGQRGVGVKLLSTFEEAAEYLGLQTGAVIAQPYNPGPFEAGVFYYRTPGSARGRILSITDKHFPVIAGDGTSTVEELVWRHPRYRMQAGTFLQRHRGELSRVLALGERLQLAIAGNHAQGTLFRDGRRLLTPALERRIDDIARACPGFFVGRFDIRYSDEEAFKAGQDIAIVELNGATAESTNIYDPDSSLLDAYRQLFRQWSIVFEIGAANRAGGAPVSSRRRLLELVRAHLATPVAFAIS